MGMEARVTGDVLRLLAMMLIAANLGLALWLLLRRDARWAMALWAVVLFFTPLYLNVTVQGLTLTILDIVTIVALASGVPGGRLRWSVIDTLVLVAFVALFAGLLFGAVPGHVQYSVISWLLPYAWGRVVVARVGFNWVAACVSVAAVIAATLTIVEFATGVNMFVLLPGVDGAMWTGLQYRGGVLRAEGAFGHSISLGSSLALSAAFVLSVQWRFVWKALVFCVIVTGTVLTFSRIGLVGILLVIAFSILFLGRYIRAKQRMIIFAVTVVGMLIALPIIMNVFDDAGDEASGSAEYRADLIPLIGKMAWLGITPAREVSANGIDYYAGYRSIDSALILTGLRHGLVPLLILALALVFCAWIVFTGRGSPAAVAVLSQVPALATVALITQYANFFWFMAGVAVASYKLEPQRPPTSKQLEMRTLHNDRLGAW